MEIEKLKEEILSEICYQISNLDNTVIESFQGLLKNNKDKLILFTGIGKSSIIAQMYADLLKSISFKTFYINPFNIIHGDLGCFNNTLVFIVSKSGDTDEILHIFDNIKSKSYKTALITCTKNNKLSRLVDFSFTLPILKEIKGNISQIPSSSIISYCNFLNIVVYILKNDVSKEEYLSNHPGGSIGKSFLEY